MHDTPRRPLTRERILEAALDYVDRNGLEALSMRKLGAELGVEAMSLYNHVPSKAAVLDGIVELLMARIEIEPRPGQDWADRLRVGARSFRRLALEHPRFVALLVTRPSFGPRALRPVEAALATLRQAGFDARTAMAVFRALEGYLLGFVIAEVSGPLGNPEHTGRERVFAAGLAPEAFPNLCECVPLAEAADRDELFDFGLDLVISGIELRLRGQPRAGAG